MPGMLIAFEGLDQSGKQTQAELLRDRLKQDGHKSRLVSFPDYGTSIGEEIARALQGEREYGPDVMQLLYIANRYERKPDLQRWLDGGLILVCDRYIGSSVAYGEALGLDAAWLTDMQKFLPAPALTILLDIAPETAVAAQSGRPRPVRARSGDAGARARQLSAAGAADDWVVLDGERRKDAIAGRRLQRGRVTTRAAVSARTSRAPRLLQRPRARFERRTRRADVVDQDDDCAAQRRARTRARANAPRDVAVPASAGRLGLRRRCAHAAERLARPAGRAAAPDRQPD